MSRVNKIKKFEKKYKSVNKKLALKALIERPLRKSYDKTLIKLGRTFHVSSEKLIKNMNCINEEEVIKIFRENLNCGIFLSKNNIDKSRFIGYENLYQKIVDEGNKCINNEFFIFERWVPNVYDVKTNQYNWHWDMFNKSEYLKDYYKDVRKKNKIQGSDLKLPWELSRMQYLTFLAKAYILTENEIYSEKIVDIISNWIKCNPPKIGVNWNCTMDVGLRISSVLVILSVIKQSIHLTDEFILLVAKSTYEHGIHIMSNLENISLSKDNHYLSNIFGMLFIGTCAPVFKESRKWREFAINELFIEIDRQTNNDGMNYEGSTSYHRLVGEIFYYALVQMKWFGVKIPKNYYENLKKIKFFLEAIIKNDDRIPQIGDNDSGRAFLFSSRNFLEHRYLCELIGYELNLEKKPQFFEEFLWIYIENINFSKSNANYSRKKQIVFPESKVAIMKDNDIYLLMSAISNGDVRMGGHTHNDKLAIELQLYGEDFIVDPGTGVYTSDKKIRHKFRQTKQHSTIVINYNEQCKIDIQSPFVLENEELKTGIEIVKDGKMIGWHNGYKDSEGVIHERHVEMFPQKILITDFLKGQPCKSEVRFILSPHLRIKRIDSKSCFVYGEKAKILIEGQGRIEIEPAMYSSGYYNLQNTFAVSFSVDEGVNEIVTRISYEGKAVW